MDFRKLLNLVTGNTILHTGTPTGSGLALEEIDYMISRGMGRQVTVGAFSTGIVGGGAGTILDLDQPELVIGVPAGVVIRPLRFSAQVQVALVAADNEENEILLAVDSLGAWNGDGTFTLETPSNMRTSSLVGSACAVGSAFSADMTTKPVNGPAADPVLDIELARAVETFDIFSTGVGVLLKRIDLLYEPIHPPYLVGPASLIVYFGGTVANVGGFIQGAWIEGTPAQFYL